MEPNNVNILTYQNLNLINPGFESVLSTKNPLTVVWCLFSRIQSQSGLHQVFNFLFTIHRDPIWGFEELAFENWQTSNSSNYVTLLLRAWHEIFSIHKSNQFELILDTPTFFQQIFPIAQRIHCTRKKPKAAFG